MMHYSVCNCPVATLDWIDAERDTIKQRLVRLDEIEREAVRRKLINFGVVTQDKRHD